MEFYQNIEFYVAEPGMTSTVPLPHFHSGKLGSNQRMSDTQQCRELQNVFIKNDMQSTWYQESHTGDAVTVFRVPGIRVLSTVQIQ